MAQRNDVGLAKLPAALSTRSSIAVRDGIYIFRVEMDRNCWRRIAMPAGANLDTFLDWILKSIQFDLDHLYEFSWRDRRGATVSATPSPDVDDLDSGEVRIGELPLEPGQSMGLVYDFGDNWTFTIKLEAIEPPDRKTKKPRILEKHGRAPQQYPVSDGW